MAVVRGRHSCLPGLAPIAPVFHPAYSCHPFVWKQVVGSSTTQ